MHFARVKRRIPFWKKHLGIKHFAERFDTLFGFENKNLRVGRVTTPSEDNAKNIEKSTDRRSSQETQRKVELVRFCEIGMGVKAESRFCN